MPAMVGSKPRAGWLTFRQDRGRGGSGVGSLGRGLFIYTDISRDGMQTGVNIPALQALLALTCASSAHRGRNLDPKTMCARFSAAFAGPVWSHYRTRYLCGQSGFARGSRLAGCAAVIRYAL